MAEIKKRVETEAEVAKLEQQLQSKSKPKSRAKYMRDYRRRPKKCKYCGSEL